MLKDLKKMKQLYDNDVNILDYIKNETHLEKNTAEMIMIGYDLQAGSYIHKASKNPEWEDEFASAYAKILDQLGEHGSLLEVGVGEATTLRNVLTRLSAPPEDVFGFDISFSRIKYAREYLKKNNVGGSTLFMGDLFNAAITDNAIDVVYTSHSLEPNGGREKEALSELYRMTKNYLVLFEPMYELASDESRRYMEKRGYIQGLYSTAIELGYKVIEHKLLFKSNPNSLNNTGVLIIEKDNNNKERKENPLACPITKAPLELIHQHYYCKDSLLLYPIVDQIPCLLPGNAIIATHYLDEFS